jgi:hypothetical protein
MTIILPTKTDRGSATISGVVSRLLSFTPPFLLRDGGPIGCPSHDAYMLDLTELCTMSPAR